jgi:excisionase family DNA binding protein
MRSQGKAAMTSQLVTPAGGRAGEVPPAGGPAARPGPQLLYRIPEVMDMLAMSRSVLFEQLRNGRLRSVRQGRSRRIPASAVADYVSLLEREAAEESTR